MRDAPSFRASAIFIAAVAVLIRLLTGLHSYSGAGNPPKYGDYEAQRHWMELTINLPVSDWYRNTTDNDLGYWGLDYPPLTAYQSYIHGVFMRKFDEQSVALHSSRGYESLHSKVLMRWTVVLSDLAIFFPAAIAFVAAYYRQRSHEERVWVLALILLQPALILIDHGHFQYNCLSLGLAIGAAAAVISRWEIVACVLFSLSLNHKQMSMYYAPAFFSHLLGISLRKKYPVLNVLKLGAAVLSTFALCWWPFLHSREAVLQVLSRLVPIHRGLFEDYVSNFWCVSNLLIKWKQLLPDRVLVQLAFVATLACILPSMLQQILRPSRRGFLLAMFNCSFAFYFFSYQVHEKSILLPVIPGTLLALDEPLVWRWLIPGALMSMFPLLVRDGLLLPYFALLLLFFLGFVPLRSFNPVAASSLLGGFVLHLAYLLLDPPARYPYLFEAFIATYTFAYFAAIFLYTNYRQWSRSRVLSSTQKRKKKV
ncbi:Dol-P-Glc: alpha-1,3-glucosyltransferase [Selaginella moellendorffii]|uniref:Alpha-1,3-glucosyltransferase n=1 Tax=Selaginella moellendorffii TaxID=88036 RepID=D8SCH8_SELML|nr:probable dolichyl pyrophosphate Man9GlcNAc2 alpha-1,3-glucosyltransferase [Selaginella moellendorffii]EFJ17714.1 Dol-P-Glc: alpha-1,3-glucosyltransferase [Selaginella moellendorffii]|eukprot:XP_002981013.1 probable dolichyl pyrophosphate Man9GlcNAc2 alpha-1,3-glucosyltransferase [Selaginella moellendorffii]